MTSEPINAGGGLPFQEALRQAFVESITAEDIGEIAKALVKRAKEGSIAAARLVLNLVIGPPASCKKAKTDVAEAANHAHANATERRGYVVPGEEKATFPIRGGLSGPQVFTEPMPSRFARSEKREDFWQAAGRLGRKVLQEIEEKKARDKGTEANVSANGEGEVKAPAQKPDAKL
ncbi:MAG TPA: hypothetical protein VE988_25855 [Gemmataceae bacterium]|nr:hypothetical protein [Gemmataceae bacterium]